MAMPPGMMPPMAMPRMQTLPTVGVMMDKVRDGAVARRPGGAGEAAGGFVNPVILDRDADVPEIWTALITGGEEFEMG